MKIAMVTSRRMMPIALPRLLLASSAAGAVLDHAEDDLAHPQGDLQRRGDDEDRPGSSSRRVRGAPA